MSNVARNIVTVKGIYQSFGAKDLPAILERLHEDVEWEMGVGSGHGVPWLEPGRGRQHALGFFQALAAVDFHGFEVVSVMGDQNFVVALVNVDITIKATGKRFQERYEAHTWLFDDRGQVVGFRHGVDTHQHYLAWKG